MWLVLTCWALAVQFCCYFTGGRDTFMPKGWVTQPKPAETSLATSIRGRWALCCPPSIWDIGHKPPSVLLKMRSTSKLSVPSQKSWGKQLSTPASGSLPDDLSSHRSLLCARCSPTKWHGARLSEHLCTSAPTSSPLYQGQAQGFNASYKQKMNPGRAAQLTGLPKHVLTGEKRAWITHKCASLPLSFCRSFPMSSVHFSLYFLLVRTPMPCLENQKYQYLFS